MAIKPETPRKILIVRLSAMGDVLFGLPALEVLARALPQTEIHWLAEEKTRQLVEHHPRLARTILFPRASLSREFKRPWLWPRALARLVRHVAALRAERYDAVIDLQGNLKSAFQVLLARGRRKIGFKRSGTQDAAWLFYGERVDPGPVGTHRIVKDLRLLTALGIDPEFHRPLLPARPDADQEAAAFWAAVPGSGPEIVIHPGSSAYNAYKRWPTERYGELARELRKRHDARLVVMEGPGEGPLVERLTRAAGGEFAVCRNRDLVQVSALIKRARFFIGGDSAPMHLAHLQGVPCVAFFGPKSPSVYGPYTVPHRILHYPTPCHPCRLRSCPLPLCTLGIQVRAALAAVESLLDEIGPERPA